MMASPHVTGAKRDADCLDDADDDEQSVLDPPTTEEMKAPAMTPDDRTPALARQQEDDAVLEEKAPVPTGQEPEDFTMPFPSELPMQYDYAIPRFYVRECYSTYYDEIHRLLGTGDPLRNRKIVTVTGTPGIGKSIFFAYFFLRYREEHPDTTVITASFSRHHETEEVVVWEPGKDPRKRASQEGRLTELIEEAEKTTTQVIHLYDGPPRVRPKGVQMVCFTSPNERWLSEAKSTRFRVNIYMPMWDLDELRAAANLLDLQVTVDKGRGTQRVSDLIDERFQIFGGVARDCLATNATYLRLRRKKIDAVINTLDDVNVSNLLSQKEGERTHHFLYHYEPNPDSMMEYTIAPPTPYVKRRLEERFCKLVDAGDD